MNKTVYFLLILQLLEKRLKLTAELTRLILNYLPIIGLILISILIGYMNFHKLSKINEDTIKYSMRQREIIIKKQKD
jgi:hypothetical protein